jgi:hypothetical protein
VRKLGGREWAEKSGGRERAGKFDGKSGGKKKKEVRLC